VPPTEDDRLRAIWHDVLARWEGALSTRHSPDLPRISQVRAKRRGWPFWPGANIFLTGEEGSGKTVLARSILSKIDPAAGSDDLPPRSPGREDYKFRFLQREPGGRLRVQLTVAPGQKSAERRAAEDLAFGGRPTRMLIHAVCWGRSKTWIFGQRLVTIEELQATKASVELEDIFTEYKKRELENFRRIGERVRTAWQDQHALRLIIAVTMCDLFRDRLAEARDYYVPGSAELRAARAEAAAREAEQAVLIAEAAVPPGGHGGAEKRRVEELREQAAASRVAAKAAAEACTDPDRTGFARALEELVRSIGPQRFSKVAVVPVSAVGVPRQFGLDSEKQSLMDRHEISQLLDRFVATVGEFCAAEEDDDGR
jgi:hypothetical protein